ncbi:ferric iron reductase FhuF-like transporter-domain-containing protein [Aspergillus lucknowensis]|uniref:Ferric iron reductase FhuF-like transporter-domain-containing protein n=1 Tax=Aspergillus lucknowensis TaxID=176173 RepID=A0ABR4LDH0_9EURO
MTAASLVEVARFETTRRLLSHLVNEGLCAAFPEPDETDGARWLRLTSTRNDSAANSAVRVRILPGKLALGDGGRVTSVIRPHLLRPPVLLLEDDQPPRAELDPGVVFQFVYPWFGEPGVESMRDPIAEELQNAAANQEIWLEVAAQQQPLDLYSPAIEWEKTLITGHPTHPSPLPQIEPRRVIDMLSPEVLFLSVPRSQIRTSGPFEELLSDLLTKLDIPATTDDRIIIPALAQQAPSIVFRFNDVLVLGSTRVSAQASMRTLTVPRELQFKYHLKLSLACQITSALRTITPWTALGGAEVSEMLEKLLPPGMWVFKEVAAVTGAQENFNDAKHLSCILREDLELRANKQDESLIIASALSQLPVTEAGPWKAQAESLLPTEGKKEWLKSYTSRLLNLTLTPLANHGVGLEAHGQNMCVRICRKTREVKGFAIRDFGGIRLHMPTLRSQGYDLHTIPPGAATMTDDLHDVWSKVHHSLFQNHLGSLIVALGLEEDGGWEIVRNEVKAILQPADGSGSASARDLYEFLTAETMPFKCFLRMRMEGKYRDYVERKLPNVVLY